MSKASEVTGLASWIRLSVPKPPRPESAGELAVAPSFAVMPPKLIWLPPASE